ncbi:hypothetical protein PILCRDRAFT_6073 [Piloderma croceum F 1598]|uniref:Uncharacterized protein n=1 Tax=Piloderma croceum (strain F 1598) TaxID=765440 RepID=A0A0C3BFS7_PILCF|nr:hypothetical protein PILCRDRAFT_6073 [Piloderma croceum F 1598]
MSGTFARVVQIQLPEAVARVPAVSPTASVLEVQIHISLFHKPLTRSSSIRPNARADWKRHKNDPCATIEEIVNEDDLGIPLGREKEKKISMSTGAMHELWPPDDARRGRDADACVINTSERSTTVPAIFVFN